MTVAKTPKASPSLSEQATTGKKVPQLVRDQIGKLPDWLKVGGHQVRIKPFHDEDWSKKQCWGQYRAGSLELLINDECPSLGHLGTIFLHETQHAIWDAYKLEQLLVGTDDTEEMVVEVGSLGLWQVFRDNPWLLPWLLDCLRFDHNRAPLE